MPNAFIENPRLGYISIFLCCVANAVSFVFIAHLNQTHNEMLSIAMTFGYAIILFNLFNYKSLMSLYSNVSKNFKLTLRMNVITLFNWLSSFMALNYLDPATAFCIILGVVAVTIFIVSTPRHKIKDNLHLAICVLLILVSMGLIINQYAHTALHSNVTTLTIGTLWCVLGGVTGAFIGTNSEKMGKAGFSISQILATRFYLLVIVSSVAFFITAPNEPIAIDWKYYLLSSLVIVFFPLIMYQMAIKSLGTLIVSLLEPFTPVITYFLQVLLLGAYQFNLLTFSLLTIASGSIIWLAGVEQNMARKNDRITSSR